MQKRRIALIPFWLACALILSACGAREAAPTLAPTSTPVSGAQIANPASAYCVERGYVSQIRTAEDGSQSGVCIFPDDTECEEWAFFRGQCSPGTPQMTPTPSTTERVSIVDIGLSFDIPKGWERQGQEWAWAPYGDSTQHLGVAWQGIEPGKEPESILPQNAVMAGRSDGPALTWGAAATYRLQVMVPGGQGQVKAVEMHVLVRGADTLYDIYASASSEPQLVALQPLLERMVQSVSLAE